MNMNFQVAVHDPLIHNSDIATQLEIVRAYTDAGIRVWVTDSTMNWWPDGLLDQSRIGATWKHAFWDRYAQIGHLSALVPEATWGVALDTRRKPDILAQLMLTLHELTRGRVLFTLGAGEIKQIAPFGYDTSKPFTRLEEAIEVVRKIWSREIFDFQGKTIQLKSAQQTLRSWDGSTPPISTIGLSDRIRKIAVANCEYVMVQGSQDEVREQQASYRAEAERIGRDPATLKFWGIASRDGVMTGRWFTFENEGEIAALKKDPMFKFSVLGGHIPGPNKYFGETYHYARDMIPTEWPKERVMEILDRVPDAEAERIAVFHDEDGIADRIVASVEVGIDIIRFTDRTAEILPSRLANYPAFWARALAKAKQRLEQAG